jgi:sugar O-acyltransferase (sialic acid O-acetyltransferase NeuD family)
MTQTNFYHRLEPIIIGAGGFAREVQADYYMTNKVELKLFVDDNYWQNGLYKLSDFNPQEQCAIIAVGSPADKKKILSKLPENTLFWTHISEKAYISDGAIYDNIGVGTIICAGTILTTNVKIGNYVHLNLNTTVGHDTVIGDYVTTAPSVSISGNVTVGKSVYFGTNCAVREKLTICDDVILGLNSGVVKNITESGLYIGTPAVKIIK